MHRIRVTVAVIVGGLAVARSGVALADGARSQALARDVLESETFDPSMSSPTAIPVVGWKSQAALESSTTGDGKAQARLAGSWSVGEQTLTFDMKINGPIDKPSGEAKLASLDGLANSVNGDFGLGMLIWNPKFAQGSSARRDEICHRTTCRTARREVYCASKFVAEQVEIDKKIEELEQRRAQAEKVGAPRPDILSLQLDVQRLSEQRAQATNCDRIIAEHAGEFGEFDCEGFFSAKSMSSGNEDASRMRTVVLVESRFPCSEGLDMSEADRDVYRAALEENLPPVLLSVRAKVGGETFKFAETTSLVEKNTTEVNYALSASVGVLLNPVGLLALNYRHEEAYKSNPKTSLCQPLPGFPETSTCNDISLGAPKLADHEILQLELRRFFSEKFAINPKVSYDASDSVTAIEGPVYFLWNKDAGLNGGVNVGWRSDTDEVTATLFVGAALTLFGLP